MAPAIRHVTKPVNPALQGPQVGAPPSLEWIALDRLAVDPAYQRATDSPASRKIIVAMVKRWDWTLCQPLVVSRRADGSLWILDGQHRHAGAVQRGDIIHLPCVVLGGIAVAEEAQTFVALNEQRQRLSQADIFFAMLAAGDDAARQVQALIEETGWRVVRSRNTALRKAGELECAPMLVGQLRGKGALAVRFALSVLRSAYPEEAVRPAATLLNALGILFANLLSEGDSAKAIIATLGKVDPDTWILQGRIFRERHPSLSGPAALARVIVDAARAPRSPVPAPPTNAAPTSATPPAQPVTAPILAEDAFGSSGKGWCDQCDQLVSRDRAAACRDTHCRLKAAA